MIYVVIGLLAFIAIFGMYCDSLIKELKSDLESTDREERYSTRRYLRAEEFLRLKTSEANLQREIADEFAWLFIEYQAQHLSNELGDIDG